MARPAKRVGGLRRGHENRGVGVSYTVEGVARVADTGRIVDLEAIVARVKRDGVVPEEFTLDRGCEIPL